MSEPEAVLRRLFDEGFSRGNLDVCDELIAPDLEEHQDFGPGHAPGPEGVKAVMRSLREAYSDFRLEIQDLVVDGDRVWARCIGCGTNDGVFMGHAPTGRTIRSDVFELVRVRDGKIVEHWGCPDRLGALMQLGHIRPPAPVPA
jgi:predicted ester cyclase